MTDEQAGRKCGWKLSNDRGTCKNAAGAGTEHLGWGACKWHGGNSPMLKIHAAKQEAAEMVRTYGALHRTVIDPDEALLGEVHRTASIVSWLEALIGDMGINDLTVLTDLGARPRAFLDIYQSERAHLAKVAKMTLDAGVQERQVRLAEEQGALLAKCIQGILRDLKLDPDQQARSAQIVTSHLKAVS